MALIDNIVSYWKLDGDSTDSADSNDGTISGATYTTSGKINGCYSFDGSNDKITIGTPTNLDLSETDYSISVWFYADTSSANRIIIGTDDGGAHSGIVLRFSSSETVQFFQVIQGSSEGGFIYGSITSSVLATGWHHVVATKTSANGMILYIDGSSAGTDTSANAKADIGSYTRDWMIGARDSTSPFYFDDKIDEVGIWTRALSSTEVTSLYNSGDGFQYPFSSSTGFNMKVNIGDVWKDVAAIKINVGDTWKDVSDVKQNIVDIWKVV